MSTSLKIPTILIIFGATGDLMAKKILPALFHLFKKNELPKRFHIVAFSRRNLSDEEFRKHILDILKKHKDINVKFCKEFCKIFSYHQGFFQEISNYFSLAEKLRSIDESWSVCSNKIFYLAVPPEFYKTILKNLKISGLTKPCSDEEGWTRILIEKPFGKDLKTAQELDYMLGKFFKEEQIYRIDHYLAKEMLQNILSFRFTNNLFEEVWNNKFIEKIEIHLWEKIGVEGRGGFYDGIGALRDVGQNHMLQMLALVTMDHPINFESKAIRQKRAEILKTLIPPSEKEIKNFTFRAQYKGYRDIEKVSPKSKTETYFKARAFLSHPRWRGVPIILDSGKRLKEQRKEIEIFFKHPQPCLCPPGGKEHYTNKIIISFEPKEAITVNFWSKKPGFKFDIEKRRFNFIFRKKKSSAQYVEEYEKLLFDAIIGDQTLFVSTEEVRAMWRFIDPIIKAWHKNLVPLAFYSPDTDEPIKKSEFINQSVLRTEKLIKKEIGLIGLGKMGHNMALRLIEKGWKLVVFDKNIKIVKELEKENILPSYSIEELVKKISPPRIIWLMIPAGKAIDEIIFGKNGLINYLNKGDIVIDGGNSFYKDSIIRFKKLKKYGINFVDVGVSGGPEGARYGASLMIGGEKTTFQKLEPLFYDLAQKDGYQFFEGAGAGHFVKMIHNGIEYGMMQAIAEGFVILKKSKYKLNLSQVADVYNNGSVIESKLIAWLKKAFDIYGDDLKNISGSVGHTGEGEWTVKTAKELKIKAKVIEEAVKFRIQSEKNPSYMGKILSALREQFGGHKAKVDKAKSKYIENE